MSGRFGVKRVAWVSEGLAHTIIGLEDELGVQDVVSYHDWRTLVLEADFVSPTGDTQ